MRHALWSLWVCVLVGCAVAPLAAPRLPAVHGAETPPSADPRYREYVGVIHIHTTYSDGTAGYAEVARIARRQGLDFLLVTDHNTLQPLADGREGWYPEASAPGRTLVLANEEVSAPDGHVLALGVATPVDRAQSSQAIIDAITWQGGLAFLAHPQYPRRPWTNWQVQGYTGLEVYNIVEDAARASWTRHVVFGLLAPPDDFYRSLIRRPSATLARWDTLLASGRRVVGIGAVDAHGLRLWRLRLAPYDVLFKAVRTHLLLPELSKTAILEALREGHAFWSVGLLGDATGLVFRAEADGAVMGVMGDAVPWRPGLTLTVFAPAPAVLQLFKDGRLLASRRAQTWRLPVAAPGVYRLEAHRHRQWWLATNPIYVWAADGDRAP